MTAKSDRRAAREAVAAYHEEQLGELLRHVERAVERFRTGELNSFEVDELHPSDRTGWSVLIRGLAELVTPAHDTELAARTRSSGATPWAPGDKTSWLRIIPHGISGRRIEHDEEFGWRLGTAAYM